MRREFFKRHDKPQRNYDQVDDEIASEQRKAKELAEDLHDSIEKQIKLWQEYKREGKGKLNASNTFKR